MLLLTKSGERRLDMKKISLAILLAMAMLLTLLPTAAMALEEEGRNTTGYDGVELPAGPDTCLLYTSALAWHMEF